MIKKVCGYINMTLILLANSLREAACIARWAHFLIMSIFTACGQMAPLLFLQFYSGAEVLSQPLFLYILEGKWLQGFTKLCKPTRKYRINVKNRVCTIPTSLKVYIWYDQLYPLTQPELS